MPLEPSRDDTVSECRYDDVPRCNDTDGGTPGGCRYPARQRIALIHGDGTESRYGSFCDYHAGIERKFWTEAVAVEWRRMDGTVIDRVPLVR